MPSEEGAHRKYYSLTASGRDLLERSDKTWRAFADTVAALLDARPAAA